MNCQSCDSPDLELGISLGYLAPCNFFLPIGDTTTPVPTMPHDVYFCTRCGLAQLGHVPPQTETFPASYPYTSSTTRALRDNFAELYAEHRKIDPLKSGDLVIDIGGNDGNLLSHWPKENVRVNVTPEDIGRRSEELGIVHWQRYWDKNTADVVQLRHGKAKLITATNVFAHVPGPHDFLEGVLSALAPGGIFVSESHYLPSLLQGVQFDAIYGEHARYLSLQSIRWQLHAHDMMVIGARRIPTHGGSIRVYAKRRADGERAHLDAMRQLAADDARRMIYEDRVTAGDFTDFRGKVVKHRRDMQRALGDLRRLGMDVVGIGAPSRAATLISYDGINADDVPCILEAPGSHKIGKMMPGTRIPVCEESGWDLRTADAAVMFSHHIGHELKASMRGKGFRGKFVTPLPEVRVE